MNTPTTATSTANLLHTFEQDGEAYTIRRAIPADIPFLAHMQYEASLPPANFSFWDAPIYDMGISGQDFIETVLRLNAGAWGSVDEFFVLEHAGEPIAAAAGIEAGENFARGPVQISRIADIGQAFGWSAEQTTTFHERYSAQWPDPQGNFILMPQAPWIIESVAVVPEMRGRGLVRPLMAVILEEGKRRSHQHVGVSVADGNEAARRVYERLGFQLYVAFGPAFFGDDAAEQGFGGYTKFKMPLR